MVECASRTVDVKSVVLEVVDHDDSDYDSNSTGDGCGDLTTADGSTPSLDIDRVHDSKPVFENIAVNNSTDIHFGNKTFYNGPVTIKHVVYANVDDTQDSECSVSTDGQKGVVPTADIVKCLGNGFIRTPGDVDLQAAPVLLSQLATHRGSLTHPRSSKGGAEDSSPEVKWFLPKGLTVHRILIIAALAIVVALLVILTVMVLKHNPNKADVTAEHETVGLATTVGKNFTLSGKLRLIERQEWLAQPVAAPPDRLVTPVPYVIISHTATEQCLGQAACVLQVRTIQTFHIESKGWWDIAYNFLVGGDGYAYVGRSWDAVGAHTYGFNNQSIGISFIGTFNKDLPPERQLLAAKQLIELGVSCGKISENYKLLAHRQLSATESPGLRLSEELKKWPHWASEP